MQSITNQIKEVVVKPILDQVTEKYRTAIERVEDIKSKGIDLGEEVSKEKLQSKLNDATKEITEAYDRSLKKFGSAMSLLADGTVSLISRIAGSAAGIISTTPVGPGVSPNLLMPLLQQLKGEGDNLSKVFDDAKVAWDELGIDKLPGSSAIDAIKSGVNTIFTTAKSIIMAVGSNCDGESSSGIPTPSIPIEVPELDPNDCKNYSGSQSEGERTAAGCSAYEEMIAGKERSCNNCKKFKK